MGLGGVGVTLQDLAQLYAGLARLGTAKPLREIMNVHDDPRDSLRLLDQVAAWQVANVLMGTPPPENGVHGRIAFKTGTSYGYRDAWSVGFDGRMTIGVWVGRPDGAPVPGVNGMAVGVIDGRRQRLIDPPGPGFARLTVIDAAGAVDTVVIRIQ